MPEFEWDEAKRRAVLAKHGIDFVDTLALFDDPHVLLPARSVAEVRQLAVGAVNGKLTAVVFTERNGKIRLITARRARENEQRAYRHRHG